MIILWLTVSLPSLQVLYRLDERSLSLLTVYAQPFQWLASVLESNNWFRLVDQKFWDQVCRARLQCEHMAFVLLHVGLCVWTGSAVAGWKTHHSEVGQLWIPHQWHHHHHFRTGTVLHVQIFQFLCMLNSPELSYKTVPSSGTGLARWGIWCKTVFCRDVVWCAHVESHSSTPGDRELHGK